MPVKHLIKYLLAVKGTNDQLGTVIATFYIKRNNK